MPSPIGVGLLVAGVVGITHWASFMRFTDEASFDPTVAEDDRAAALTMLATSVAGFVTGYLAAGGTIPGIV